MKAKYFLTVLMLAAATALQAQDMTVKSFKPNPGHLGARDTKSLVLDFNDQPCALIRVTVKPKPAEEVKFIGNIVGNVEYVESEQCYWVYMPDGNSELTVVVPSIGRARVDFAKHGVKRVKTKEVYDLEINSGEPRRTFIMVEGAMGSGNQLAFGAMVAMVQKHGGYVHGRFDFGSAPTSLECDDTGKLTAGDYEGHTPFYNDGTKKKSRFSITGGYMYRIAKPLYAFVGVGYGTRTLAWETVDGDWVKNTDHSASGIAAEIGGILRFGKVGISLNYQTIAFKYHEAGLGVGLFF